MHKDENGYIVVETIGTFIPFVLLIVSILSLINIVTVQSRVHYALTQAANTLSMYSYTLEATGIADILKTIDHKGSIVDNEVKKMQNDIGLVFDEIQALSLDEAQRHGEAALERAHNWGESIADDPKNALQLVMNYGLNEGRNALFKNMVAPLVAGYLDNGKMTGKQYLEHVHVIGGLSGLDFEGSTLIDMDGNVKITVKYEIEYKFGALPLPFEPKLKINQSVKTKAWLNGSGEGYR